MKKLKVIISGGGTGGHIFPAVALAGAFKKLNPENDILFVGAKGRMEMEKVPEAGYKIIGLDIAGIQRKMDWRNLLLPFKVLKSVLQSRRIIRDFKPDLAIGVGGYASGPLLYAAGQKSIPYFIQEQNSYAGITNKILGKKAKRIFVAYENMQQFFPSEKVMLLGNPVRHQIEYSQVSREEGLKFFGLQDKRTVLVIGGSLGARTINMSIKQDIEKLKQAGINVIWQTGKAFYPTAKQLENEHVRVFDFIKDMDKAYAAADVLVSRAGALSIAEICALGKAVILVPSPNVAEDHQSKNARALTDRQAAILIRDADAQAQLADAMLALVRDEELQQKLSANAKAMHLPDAAMQMVKMMYELI